MGKKPNYDYEKRQKEISRQAKKEEKRKRKQDGSVSGETPQAEQE
ncbi:hypothetical protein [Pelobacter seleniigenes]|nr:hypothetical protein [Pelobacter seleniigenes]